MTAKRGAGRRMTDHRALIENTDETARRLAALDVAADIAGARLLTGSIAPVYVPDLVRLADWILDVTPPAGVELPAVFVTGGPDLPPPFRSALDALASAVQEFLGTGPLGVGCREQRDDPKFRFEFSDVDRYSDLDAALADALDTLGTAAFLDPKDN